MIDIDYIDVQPNTESNVVESRPTPKPKPPTPPRKVKLEPEPKPVIPEPKPGVDTTRISEASQAFAASSAAKLMILLTWLAAISTKTPPLMMKDEEAIAIAIPMTTLLLRIKFIAELFKEYGQYFLSFDEWILLAVALYAYYGRVEHDLERNNPNHEPTRPIRTEQTSNEFSANNGLVPIARPIEWRTA